MALPVVSYKVETMLSKLLIANTNFDKLCSRNDWTIFPFFLTEIDDIFGIWRSEQRRGGQRPQCSKIVFWRCVRVLIKYAIFQDSVVHMVLVSLFKFGSCDFVYHYKWRHIFMPNFVFLFLRILYALDPRIPGSTPHTKLTLCLPCHSPSGTAISYSYKDCLLSFQTQESKAYLITTGVSSSPAESCSHFLYRTFMKMSAMALSEWAFSGWDLDWVNL